MAIAEEVRDEAGPGAGRTRRARPGARLTGRRLLAAIPVLWGVTFLTYVVMNLLPGDAAQELLGANATPAQVHQLEIQLHLNEPFWVRYGGWLGGLLHGNLGTSLASRENVTTLLGQRLPVTAELLIYAFAGSIVFAVGLAVLAARKPNGIADRISMVVSMTGLSVARSATLSLRGQTFMLAARLAGTSRRRMILRHVVPNIMPQLLTFSLLGIGVAIILEGAL